jgi:hypothetical protein
MQVSVNVIFGHALRVYRHMEQGAKEVTWENLPVKVWEGSITQLTSDLRISNSYYTRVIGGLESSGCVSMLRRGSGNRGSLIALHRPPVEETFVSDLTPRPSAANLTEQRLKDLESNVGGIDIGKALVEIHQRLEVLERGNTDGTTKEV